MKADEQLTKQEEIVFNMISSDTKLSYIFCLLMLLMVIKKNIFTYILFS